MSEISEVLAWQNAMYLVKELPPEQLYGLLNRVRRKTTNIKADCIFIAQSFNNEIASHIRDAVELEYISQSQAEPILIKTQELSTMLNTLKREKYNGK